MKTPVNHQQAFLEAFGCGLVFCWGKIKENNLVDIQKPPYPCDTNVIIGFDKSKSANRYDVCCFRKRLKFY